MTREDRKLLTELERPLRVQANLTRPVERPPIDAVRREKSVS